jgi:hypothetical protein
VALEEREKNKQDASQRDSGHRPEGRTLKVGHLVRSRGRDIQSHVEAGRWYVHLYGRA